MNEGLFLEQLSSMRNGKSTKDYRAVITAQASDRNQNEVFSVCVYRNKESMYK